MIVCTSKSILDPTLLDNYMLMCMSFGIYLCTSRSTHSELLGIWLPWLQRHRQNCMCIICKQARRKGGNAAQQSTHHSSGGVVKGAQANSLKPDTPQSWRPATTAAAARAVGPRIRSGKRAYVLACPQLIRGASTHTQQEVPSSRYWTPENFEQEQKRIRLEKMGRGILSRLFVYVNLMLYLLYLYAVHVICAVYLYKMKWF